MPDLITATERSAFTSAGLSSVVDAIDIARDHIEKNISEIDEDARHSPGKKEYLTAKLIQTQTRQLAREIHSKHGSLEPHYKQINKEYSAELKIKDGADSVMLASAGQYLIASKSTILNIVTSDDAFVMRAAMLLPHIYLSLDLSEDKRTQILEAFGRKFFGEVSWNNYKSAGTKLNLLDSLEKKLKSTSNDYKQQAAMLRKNTGVSDE
jgi:hypothetical protein